MNETIQLAEKAAPELLKVPSRAASAAVRQKYEGYGIDCQSITGP